MTLVKTLKLSGSMIALTAAGVAAGPAFANDDVTALVANPGNVVMPSMNYAGWNYSTLDQITLDNVDQLQGTMSRLPERDEIPLPVPIEERLIIEFYS